MTKLRITTGTHWQAVRVRIQNGVALGLLLCSFVTGCAHSVRSTPPPSGKPISQLKVLTYNTLHGFKPSGLTVKASESTFVRQARLDLQFGQLSVVQPEVLLLQEVNPLPVMADAYVAALMGFGLKYTEVHQVDACGARLAPGLAVAPGLNNGLAVLAKDPLRLRKVKGLKLSGGFGFCTDFMGLQTDERRYALIAEVENPDTGRKVLVVSLHLHSGIERTAFFIQEINEAVDQGKVRREDFEGIVAALEQSQERRLDEIRVLVKELRKLHAQETYFETIIGGDFNFEPDDPEYRELERMGFRDTYTIASSKADLYSLDPQRNLIAKEGIRDVPSALREAMKHLPDSQQERILEGYQTGISQARRIDFQFLMTNPSNSLKGCMRQELFGEPTTVSTELGSDHFGVLATYIADATQC